MEKIDRQTILSGVKECVAESLAIEEEEINESSLLFKELDADSIDIMDIMFLLEEKFEIKLSREEFDFFKKIGIDMEEAVVDDRLTTQAIERLKKWLPTLPADAELKLPDLANYLSIRSIVTIVEENLQNASGSR